MGQIGCLAWHVLPETAAEITIYTSSPHRTILSLTSCKNEARAQKNKYCKMKEEEITIYYSPEVTKTDRKPLVLL